MKELASMISRLSLALIACALMGTVLAGCGDDDGNKPDRDSGTAGTGEGGAGDGAGEGGAGDGGEGGAGSGGEGGESGSGGVGGMPDTPDAEVDGGDPDAG